MTFAEQLRAQTRSAAGVTCCTDHIDYLYRTAMTAAKIGKSSITVTNRDLSLIAYTDQDTIPALAGYVSKHWGVTVSADVDCLRISW